MSMENINFKTGDIIVLENINKNQKWICELKHIKSKRIFYRYGTLDVNAYKGRELLYNSYYDRNSDDVVRIANEDEKSLYNNILCLNNLKK